MIRKHNGQTKWMSHHVIHHRFYEWFSSLTVHTAPNWLYPLMLGFCTAHSVVQSWYKIHQKIFFAHKTGFSNTKWQSCAPLLRPTTLHFRSLHEQILQKTGLKNILESHPNQRYKKNRKHIKAFPKFKHLCKKHGVFLKFKTQRRQVSTWN